MKTYCIEHLIRSLFLLLLLHILPVKIADKIDGIYYKLDNKTRTAAVTSNFFNLYNELRITIPGTVTIKEAPFTTYRVTSVKSGAFEFEELLKEITLPESITSIGSSAFEDCKNLTSINLPNSITRIDAEAFEKCTSLIHITLPNSLRSIGAKTFRKCSSLTSLYIPSSVVSIGKEAFSQCPNINVINIPRSLQIIESKVFEGSGIHTIIVERMDFKLTEIDRLGLTELKEIIISENYKGLIPSKYKDMVRIVSMDDLSSAIQDLKHMQTLSPVQIIQASTSLKNPNTDLGINNEITLTEKGNNVRSDIDVIIPETKRKASNTFALIIANENYRREEKVQYAVNDGEIFAKYLKTTLGVPEKNIQLYTDASLNDIKYGLNQLTDIGKAYDGNISVIVYYAGHGIPDETTRYAYLLPVDGYSTDLSTCYSLTDLYELLGNIPCRQTLLMLDACFSGGQRSREIMHTNTRGVRLAPRPLQANGNLIVLSASQHDETAYTYENQGHGLFTYFLLKKINETKGKVSLGELADYIIQNVKRTSVTVNNKLQTPTVFPSPNMPNWRKLSSIAD